MLIVYVVRRSLRNKNHRQKFLMVKKRRKINNQKNQAMVSKYRLLGYRLQILRNRLMKKMNHILEATRQKIKQRQKNLIPLLILLSSISETLGLSVKLINLRIYTHGRSSLEKARSEQYTKLST